MVDDQDVRAALERVCSRLRTTPEARLVRADDRLDGSSVADAVHEAAAWAASKQGVGHPVPRLHPLASADQLSVVGGDFLDWAGAADDRVGELEGWRLRIERLRVVI